MQRRVSVAPNVIGMPMRQYHRVRAHVLPVY
jgi:hypothetical protein